MLAAKALLEARGLGAAATNEQINLALADAGRLAQLQAARDRVARDGEFVRALDRLRQIGLDQHATNAGVEAALSKAELNRMAGPGAEGEAVLRVDIRRESPNGLGPPDLSRAPPSASRVEAIWSTWS